MELGLERLCKCTGIRYCKNCKDPFYRSQFKDLYPITDEQQIVTNIIYRKCQNCDLGLFQSHYQGDQDCQNHHSDCQSLGLTGFAAFQNFITIEEEEQIIKSIESYSWVQSQSGRKKIDFGPKANFKKKKVKIGQFKGFPLFSKGIFQKFKNSQNQAMQDKLQGFIPVELNVLDYDEGRGSNIALHFDDFWLWGERIVGINMLSDTVMSFSKQIEDKSITIEIPVPRRVLYVIGGTSRTEWMHGIKSQHIKGRRVVITMRELSEEYNDPSNEVGLKVKEIAQNFI